MQASAIIIYKKMETDETKYTPMPHTSNLEGKYPGEGIVNYILGLMIHIYYQKEMTNELETIDSIVSNDKNRKWVLVKELYPLTPSEDGRETLEYGILRSYGFGYINVTSWDGERYFNLTDKCENMDLYKIKAGIT